MDKIIAHILMVDDDEGIRSLVKKYLNENKFLVTTAESAENALEKIKIIKFDLIVLDIMMPGKNGLEFIKENKKKLETPVILLTAKGEAIDRIEGLEIGADVQAYNADLAAISGLSSAADRLAYYTGSGAAALATFTSFGRSLVDDADAAAGRSTLGIGTMGTQAANSVAITGGTIDGVTIDAGTF